MVEYGRNRHRVNALREHVQRDGDDIEIARALAIAEQRAFDAIRARQHGQPAQATPVPRSLCGWTEMIAASRLGRWRMKYSTWSA